jgi:hypothetical protein
MDYRHPKHSNSPASAARCAIRGTLPQPSATTYQVWHTLISRRISARRHVTNSAHSAPYRRYRGWCSGRTRRPRLHRRRQAGNPRCRRSSRHRRWRRWRRTRRCRRHRRYRRAGRALPPLPPAPVVLLAPDPPLPISHPPAWPFCPVFAAPGSPLPISGRPVADTDAALIGPSRPTGDRQKR